MNPIAELSTLDVADFELEAVSVEVQAAAARQCGSVTSCCSCSTTPELDA